MKSDNKIIHLQDMVRLDRNTCSESQWDINIEKSPKRLQALYKVINSKHLPELSASLVDQIGATEDCGEAERGLVLHIAIAWVLYLIEWDRVGDKTTVSEASARCCSVCSSSWVHTDTHATQ